MLSSSAKGLILGPTMFLCLGLVIYLAKKHETYNLDPGDRPGAFEPFLVKYIRAAEFLVGLATGSIVLLVGSSALHRDGRLPPFYAAPLVLMAWCVLFGVAFMVWLTHNYEEHQHGRPHTKLRY